jgi:hypothetical protein
MAINPAQRILEIYQRLSNFSRSENGTLYAAWSKALDVESGSFIEVYRQLAEIQETIQRVRKIIRVQLPGQADLLLMHYQNVESLLQPGCLTSHCNTFVGSFSDAIMHGLTVCAAMMELNKDVHEEAIDLEQLKKLDAEVRELIEWVAESEIHEKIKGSVIYSLELVLRAVRDYRFKGIAGFEEAQIAIIGTIGLYEEIKTDPEFKDKIWPVLTRVSEIISVATALQQSLPILAPFIEKLLGS